MRDLTLFVAALVVLATFGTLEQRRQDASAPAARTYSSLDAGPGGYRGWYDLLEREGVRVDRFEQHAAFLDSTIPTLVYADSSIEQIVQGGENGADVQALSTWIRRGGNIIYVASGRLAGTGGIAPFPATRKVRDGAGRRFYSSLAGVNAFHTGATVRWVLRDHWAVLARDAAGPLVVRYAAGNGTITAVLDEDAFVNANIGRGDAARLAFAVATTSNRGRVAFDEAIHGDLVPEHWWAIVPRPYLIAIAVATVTILVALSGASARLGPPIVPALRRPTSAEFVDSLAALLQRGKASANAARDAARSTAAIVARSVGLPGNALPHDVEARLGGELRVTYAAMNAAAVAQTVDEGAMVRAIALAQCLRKEMRHAGRRD